MANYNNHSIPLTFLYFILITTSLFVATTNASSSTSDFNDLNNEAAMKHPNVDSNEEEGWSATAESQHAVPAWMTGLTFQNKTDKSEKCLEIGKKHLYGNYSDVEWNTTLAMRFINESASLGNSEAQFLLGIAYTTGIWSLPKQTSAGILNLYFASMDGHVGATMVLAHRHKYGKGVPKSCESSLLYYQLAANASIDLRATEPVDPILLDQPARRLSKAERKAVSNTGPKDAEVVDYYHYSSHKGDESAAQSLAMLYYYGARGVTQDLNKAAEMFIRAQALGSVAAGACLGHMYVHGLGVSKDGAKALKLFKKASELGSALAYNGLGYMYLNGDSVEKDTAKAKKYFEIAAKHGNSNALYNLGVMYMTSDDPDYEKASQKFHLAAQHSHTQALHKVGLMHMHGIGRERSCETALEFLKNVAERGPWNRMLDEASAHFDAGDFRAAFVQYVIMAEQGFEVSQHNAAWMIDNRYHFHSEDEDSFGEFSVALYHSASEQGNMEANLKIGDYYYYGRGGIPVHYERAVSHYRQASQRQNAQAMFNLGMMYEHGVGIPQDFHLAKRWYDISAKAAKESAFPVMLALWKLKGHMYFTQMQHKYSAILSGKVSFSDIMDAITAYAYSFLEPFTSETSSDKVSSNEGGSSSTAEDAKAKDSETAEDSDDRHDDSTTASSSIIILSALNPFNWALDSLVITALVVILVSIIMYRNERLR